MSGDGDRILGQTYRLLWQRWICGRLLLARSIRDLLLGGRQLVDIRMRGWGSAIEGSMLYLWSQYKL